MGHYTELLRLLWATFKNILTQNNWYVQQMIFMSWERIVLHSFTKHFQITFYVTDIALKVSIHLIPITILRGHHQTNLELNCTVLWYLADSFLLHPQKDFKLKRIIISTQLKILFKCPKWHQKISERMSTAIVTISNVLAKDK